MTGAANLNSPHARLHIAQVSITVNAMRKRLLIFILFPWTSILALEVPPGGTGIGGALQGSLITTIDPKMFNFQLTYNILMIVVVGGLGSVTGSVVGAVVITVLLEWLRFVEDTMTIGSFEIVGIPGMRMVIFSIVLLFIILYRREGMIGGYEFSWDSITKRFGKKGDA